ncbi:sugar kinase [Oleiphilus sp. HI0079]|uniref:sugar kinase n=1 Tax=Oleiphilus sp. HI0079 TaxID=1822254 RepID=UPI0007C20DBB|nr:sugar kinase [Oleiphilus sp. HI0079]KZZ14018.1 sugar kinase [Oleiphilus sp. HI0079]
MASNSNNSFVMITRKTRVQELIARFNSWSQAKFYLEHNQIDVRDYLDEHEVYLDQIKRVEAYLRQQGRFQRIDRDMIQSYQFGTEDIVVVVGQDGLVANTLKYLDAQPVIGINPDSARFDGVLLPFTVKELQPVVQAVIVKRISTKEVTFAKVETNDGQCMRAVNDFFIGPKSHTSARYTLRWNGQEEMQSSSGIIVSTGFGSTGWFQSILAGAMGVTGTVEHAMQSGFDWDAERLQFAVREPFPSQTSRVDVVFGEINASSPFALESHMPENGVIFSDGIESDFIQFNAGTIARISVDEQKGRLVVA